MPVPGTKTAAAMALRRRRTARTAQAGYAPRRTFNPPVGLWIAGVDYTSYLIVDSPNIQNTAYPQTGVFRFRLEGAAGSLANVKAEQEVTFNEAGVTYAGVVRAITPTDLRPAPGLGLDVDCQDFTSLLNDEICTSARSVVETDQQRVSWLLQAFDRRGLTAYNVQTLFSSLPPQDFTGLTLDNAIKNVLAFSNAKFYVDAAKDLHTFVSETSVAPFGVSDAPDNVTTFPFSDFTYPTDSVDLRNAVLATGEPGTPNTADSAVVSINGLLSVPESVIASFKPASSAAPIALVGYGPVTKGSSVLVSPTFKQATADGNCLVAWVVGIGAIPATTAAGWLKAVPAAGPPYTTLWYKPNCAASETAPTFTTSGGTQPMFAQLAEFSGVAKTTPLDQIGSAGPPAAGSLFASLTVATSAVDAAAGDLILIASSDSSLYFIGIGNPPNEPTQIFKEIVNNATPQHIGDAQSWTGGGSGTTYYSGFAYAIVRAEPTWYTDPASIALYGRREASFSNSVVGPQSALDALGAAYLAEHSNPLRHGSFACRQAGLSAGMTVNITNALYGLSSQAFRIQSVETTFSDNVPRFVVQFANPTIDLSTQMTSLQADTQTVAQNMASQIAALGAIVTTASDAIAANVVAADLIAANQSTASAAYADLATVGPTVTIKTKTQALVTLYGRLSSDGAHRVYMGFAISGATTVAASDAFAIEYIVNTLNFEGRYSATFLVTGLTPGQNTFTAKYKTDAGNANYQDRRLTVETLNA